MKPDCHLYVQQSPYCYTGGQPHTLTGTSTAADCTNPDRDYGYDAAGNTTSRPGQTLTWNTEGKLAQVTEGVVDTNYLYDASGNLLIRHTEGGERILYAGSTELHLRVDGTMWAQRYYGTADMTIAVRTNRNTGGSQTELSYLAADKHRSTTLAIDSGEDQTFVKRALTPFGEQRTEARVGDWIDDKAFIGKTHDEATALTHIGAREYDPTTGTFLSVDPVLETDKPQTLNGYTYGRQNPYTYTDPTGTHLACGGRGGSTASCPKHGQVDSSGRTGSGGMLTTESYPTEDGAVNVGTVRDRFGDIVSVSTHYREYTKPVGDGGKALKRQAGIDSIWENTFGFVLHKAFSATSGAQINWLVEGIGYDSIQGLCVNGGYVMGGGVASGACLLVTETPSRGYQIGGSLSLGPQIGKDAGVTVDRYWSNADDFEQLRGWGAAANVSVGKPYSFHAGWGSGGTRTNADGNLVGELEAGLGLDVFVADVSGGPLWTWIGEWE